MTRVDGTVVRVAPPVRGPKPPARVYFAGSEPVDPLRLSPEKIAELIIIASVEDSSAHLEVPVGTQPETVSRVRRALGLDRRIPRRRHEAASGA